MKSHSAYLLTHRQYTKLYCLCVSTIWEIIIIVRCILRSKLIILVILFFIIRFHYRQSKHFITHNILRTKDITHGRKNIVCLQIHFVMVFLYQFQSKYSSVSEVFVNMTLNWYIFLSNSLLLLSSLSGLWRSDVQAPSQKLKFKWRLKRRKIGYW